MQGYTGPISAKCLYDEWMRALAEGFIIIRDGKTEGVGKGQAILLASYMCGPCDSRLLGVYPEGQPFDKPKKDLHVTFERVFKWNPAFTRDDLAKAGFTPTCAYVWEFAKWHVEDQAAKRGKFPSVAEYILPEISDTTVFVYDSRCNRRIARAMGKVITCTEWLDYYTESGDTSAPICAKSIVDTLSKRQGNDKSLLVYCINLILREKNRRVWFAARVKYCTRGIAGNRGHDQLSRSDRICP
jgi:hypothetical protein